MNTSRIEELMKQTAYPESQSVMQAMTQVWNECQQEFNARQCKDCKWDRTIPEIHSCALIGYTRYENFGCNKFEPKPQIK